MTFNKEILIDMIKFAPGYFDPEWWASNNRVKKLEISTDDTSFIVTFKDILKIQSITLKEPLSFKEIKFTILDVYPSNKDNDTGISEIMFYYKGERIQTF